MPILYNENSGLKGHMYRNKNWKSIVFNVDPSEDISDDTILTVIASPAVEDEPVNIRVQLLDPAIQPTSSVGTAADILSFSQPRTERSLTLDKFRDVNFEEIYRVVVHYGKETWFNTLNGTNDLEINVHLIVTSKELTNQPTA